MLENIILFFITKKGDRMQEFYKNLSETTKGYLLIAIGLILLLNAMGLFKIILSNLIIIVAIIMIIIGFMRADLFGRLKGLVRKK